MNNHQQLIEKICDEDPEMEEVINTLIAYSDIKEIYHKTLSAMGRMADSNIVTASASKMTARDVMQMSVENITCN